MKWSWCTEGEQGGQLTDATAAVGELSPALIKCDNFLESGKSIRDENSVSE